MTGNENMRKRKTGNKFKNKARHKDKSQARNREKNINKNINKNRDNSKSGNKSKNKKQEQELGITVTKNNDFSEWYNQVVLKSELADYAPISGFMIVRPNAYSIWEEIQDKFNSTIRKKGVENAYFPLLIPESFFKKEAEHAEGFAPELAWIEGDRSEERVAIRPTSETIMYDSYSKWIRSWRELPLRINQWCSVLRWEVKQTKIFLRTREFLWQEGHCVYETESECEKEALGFLDDYRKLVEGELAIPVVVGEKTAYERFAGAKRTFTLESLMPDGKALQMGTSHNLGQNFAKTFDVSFVGKDEKKHFAWQNSWGFSTRLLGAIVMVHGDDKGLVLPPNIARRKAVVVPITFEDSKKEVLRNARAVAKSLSKFNAFVDDRDSYSPGWKFNEWELKGIPIRIEIGPRDIKKHQVVVVRRDTGEKKFVKEKNISKEISSMLKKMQSDMFNKAENFLKKNTVEAGSWDEFKKAINEKKMVLVPFCDLEDCEEEIKTETTATSRCIPFNQKDSEMKCIKCGRPAKHKTFFAKAY